jgi:two-component system NtrC family sensor kinase
MQEFWVVPQAPSISRVDLNKVMKSVLSFTREQFKSREVKHRLDIEPAPLTVDGNFVHLEQIFINILVNAAQALDKVERPDKLVTIETREVNQEAVITVTDNGPGLPTENPDELFDPFFSKDKGGEGMGLGLAIVKRYVSRYQGTIEAKNNPDQGCRFIVSFPLSSNTAESRK